MFVARERELDRLEEAYATDSFQLAVVYGRRRVGKTALLIHFVRSKPNAHYFMARQTVAQENLEALSASLMMQTGGNSTAENIWWNMPLSHPVYRSFSDALRTLFRTSLTQRVTLVIDEYPYLAESYPGISSLLQSLIDEFSSQSKLFLVLCGSSMSFMQEQVLGEKSPLYGRRTLQLEVRPFDAFDAARLLGTNDPIRAVELYSLVGGVPQYLEQLDAKKTTEWNIAQRLLSPSSYLSAEPENFLLQEIRSPATYNAVISAVAGGRVRPQEIADATGLKAPQVSVALARLEQLFVIQKVTPAVRAKRRQVRYAISDGLFRFHYALGAKYETAAEAGMAAAAAHRIVLSELSGFVGPAFEEICRQWLLRQMASGRIDLLPEEIGTWWGTNPESHQEEEIDIVARGSGRLLLGECKWNNSPVDSSVLGTLRRRAALLSSEEDLSLYVFSKTGFEPDCVERARADGVRLVTIGEMFADI